MEPRPTLHDCTRRQGIANAADVKLGAGGAISVQLLTATNLVIDVYGYFTDVEELGNGNTALGFRALGDNTTGSVYTAVGNGALFHDTTGSNTTPPWGRLPSAATPRVSATSPSATAEGST